MKVYQCIIAGLTLALLVAGVVVMDVAVEKQEGEMRCTGISVEMSGADMGLVSDADIRGIVNRRWSGCVGKRVDSLNLAQIEKTLDFRGEVRGSEAYITKDGVLHLKVERRVPIVKFVSTDGIKFYADADGFLFPAMKDSKKPLPTVEGDIPLQEGHNGENPWLSSLVGMFRIIDGSKTWGHAFSKVGADSRGNITLFPVQGSECFLLGQPTDIPSKLARMEDYYKYIAPTAEEGHYSRVNLSYRGQIVCKATK